MLPNKLTCITYLSNVTRGGLEPPPAENKRVDGVNRFARELSSPSSAKEAAAGGVQTELAYRVRFSSVCQSATVLLL